MRFFVAAVLFSLSVTTAAIAADGAPQFTEKDWAAWPEVEIVDETRLANDCRVAYSDCRKKNGTENKCRRVEKECLNPNG